MQEEHSIPRFQNHPPGKQDARAHSVLGRPGIDCFNGGSVKMWSCSASPGVEQMSGFLVWPGEPGCWCSQLSRQEMVS